MCDYKSQPRSNGLVKIFDNPILKGCFLIGDLPGTSRSGITVLIIIRDVLVCLVGRRILTWAARTGVGIWSREAQIKVHCVARAMCGINQAFLILVLKGSSGFHINPILLQIVLILITPAWFENEGITIFRGPMTCFEIHPMPDVCFGPGGVAAVSHCSLNPFPGKEQNNL